MCTRLPAAPQRVYKVVAGAKDQTAFLAITLLTVLGMSGFTQALGLSDTLGAFLAGVLLAETKYRYQIEADIAPFRGLLLGLFFITTGFSIDVGLAVANVPLVLGFAFGLHALKTLITFLVGTAGGLKPVVALRSSLILSQGGEFAFVLFGLAQTHGILLPKQVKLLLTVVVLSMFFTPFLNEFGAFASAKLEQRRGGLLLPATIDESEQGDYVLVCGYGRVGQAVCELLTKKLVRYKAFDMDPYRVAEARKSGLPVFYGDARRLDVIQAFIKEQEKAASAIVITLDSEKDCTTAVRALRRQYVENELPIFVRAMNEKHRRKLASSGATALETGPQESALLLGGAVLTEVGVPTSEVVTIIDDARSRMYASKIDGYEQAVEEIQRSRFALFKKRQAEEEAEAEEEAAAASKMRLMSAPTPESVDPSAPTSEIVEDGDALVVVEAAAPAETPQPIVDFVVAREEPDRDDAPSPKA